MLGLLFLSITVNLLDRQVLSLVAPILREELNIASVQYSYIVFSFLLGLTLSQIPAGALIDRRGARFGLPFIMLWWSVANGLHAAARSVLSFSVFRFLLGMGESGNYSAGVKVISEYFPPHQRALAGGIFNTGSVIGAFIAPPLIVFIARHYGWQMAFLLPSAAGLLWIAPWLATYRAISLRPAGGGARGDSPAALLGLRQVWGVMLMRALSGPVNHFYWYWLPLYLRRERGFSLEQIGFSAGLPFVFGGLGNVLGGSISSFLMARGYTPDRARKAAFAIAFAFCLSSMAVPLMATGYQALALICLASFGVATWAATWIGTVGDLFPENVLARVTGISGTGEGIVNMIFTLATGAVVDRYSYLPVFLAAGLLPGAALVSLYVFVRRIERVATLP